MNARRLFCGEVFWIFHGAKAAVGRYVKQTLYAFETESVDSVNAGGTADKEIYSPRDIFVSRGAFFRISCAADMERSEMEVHIGKE